MSQICVVKVWFSKVCCFFFGFWVSLSAPRDVVTCNLCTPAQSKPTFSCLCILWKKSAQRFQIGSTLEAVLVQELSFWGKMVPKNRFKKKEPSTKQIRDYLQARRPLETAPRGRISRNKNNNWDSNSSNCSNNCKSCCSMSVFCCKLPFAFEFVSILLLKKGKKRPRHLSHCWHYCSKGTKPVIWHALGKGPAN